MGRPRHRQRVQRQLTGPGRLAAQLYDLRARTTSDADRARVAATKALTTAIDRIAAVDETVGRHLQRRVQTGLSCSYQPDVDRPIDWILD